jgi:hypothetical protein
VYVRWGLGFGAAALVLSLLASFLSGNGFLVSLLRALVSGTVAGGLGVGLFFLLKVYLPEVLAAFTPGAVVPERPKAPGAVDFRMPAVGPEPVDGVREVAVPAEEARPGAEVLDEPVSGGNPGVPPPAIAPEAEPDPATEEIAEELPEEAEEAEAPEVPAYAPPARSIPLKAKAEDGFIVFNESRRIPNDPEQLAKAVQTIMHRDE